MRWPLLLLMLIAAPQLACGPLETERAHLLVDPQVVRLPVAAEGDSSHASLTLLNVGDGPLELQAIQLEGTGFAVTGCEAPARLEPHQACSMQVVHQPPGSTTWTARLVIRSTDVEHPELEVPLATSNPAAVLALAPAALDFGPTPSGSTVTRPLRVANIGQAAAHGLQPVWIGSSGDFEASLPAETVPPGSAVDLMVSYTPTGGDADTATLELRWDTGSRRIVVQGSQDLTAPR